MSLLLKLKESIIGEVEISLAVSEAEKPMELENMSLGKRISFGLRERTRGNVLMTRVIWSVENPWLLKRARTESGFLEEARLANLEFRFS